MHRLPRGGRAAAMTALALLLTSLPAAGHDRPSSEVGPYARQAVPATAAYESSEPPLFDDLGSLSWPVTTAKPLAQRYFDQGLVLAYGFNHAEARRAFRAAQKIDPGCAMCFWGEALVLGPNINLPMAKNALQPAVAALAAATEKAPAATPKEQALIAALARRYDYASGGDRPALDRAYADAMAEVARRWPEDVEVQVLYAEALMNLSPWSYWSEDGRTPKGRTAELVAVLERALAMTPDHPGAIHYYIHTVEASDRPERAVPHAERLVGLAPGAGHLVHMPSHVWFRVGRYKEALELNKAAAAADEAFIARTGATGPYPLAYYPHNIHFLMASAQMTGDGPTAIAAAKKLAATIKLDSAKAVPWTQPIIAAPYFAMAEFGDPRAVLAMPEPAEMPAYVRAMWRYARGAALARAGDAAAARKEAAALVELARTKDVAFLESIGIPAGRILEIAWLAVGARADEATGDRAAAITALETAVKLQDGLPYMEPPYWYQPMHRALGGAYLRAGRIEAAEAAFRASLERAPQDGFALYGLAETLAAKGDKAGAEQARRRLDAAWAGEPGLLRVDRL